MNLKKYGNNLDVYPYSCHGYLETETSVPDVYADVVLVIHVQCDVDIALVQEAVLTPPDTLQLLSLGMVESLVSVSVIIVISVIVFYDI